MRGVEVEDFRTENIISWEMLWQIFFGFFNSTTSKTQTNESSVQPFRGADRWIHDIV
ncbi:unnamed protein product, partial [Sphenostylis stenocarpa]